MVKLVLLRHGESEANYLNTYTGWSDVPLTSHGIASAEAAGTRLAQTRLQFTHVHTSLLSRAIMTAYIVQDAIGQNWLPLSKSWRLNERHYGALRGLNKDATREVFGKDQVAKWRRSYTDRPPLLQAPDLEPAYARYPHSIVPRGESLKDATVRLLPYWEDHIAPRLRQNGNQLIVAHGSTLRALIKYLEAIPDDQVDHVEVANAQPIVYTLDDRLQVADKTVLTV